MKALIAEDDLYTRQALATILRAEGWEVVDCADGKNALANFRAGGFDLVCLDIMMPLLSGYDVCREIRAQDKKVPVLFVSAKSEEIDTVLGLELGADDFIVKPFGVRELQARIRAVLRRSGPAPSTLAPSASRMSAFHFGQWEVRPGELRAFCGQSQVELSERETAMLALLAGHPAQVIRRDDFFRACWNLEQAPVSRTLDQYIVRLRRKIEADPDHPLLIRTVQGVGYRYDPVG